MACAPTPTGIGGPAVLVAVAIGVTVPEASKALLTTYAVTGLAGPGEVIDAATGAACGPAAAEPSTTTSETSTADPTRQCRTARRPVIVPADIAHRLLSRFQWPTTMVLLSVIIIIHTVR